MTATRLDWMGNAEHHYKRASECFTLAARETPNGDPQAFDQWLRMGTWQVQAVGACVGLARAVSDGANR